VLQRGRDLPMTTGGAPHGMNEPDEFIRLLEGQECRGIIAQEFWHHGVPSDLVNVVFFQVESGLWLRFFFDAGVFLWRTGAPERVTGGEPTFEYRLTNLGARFDVPAPTVKEIAKIATVMQMIASDMEPERVPSREECGRCNIADCPDRDDSEPFEGEATEF